MQITLTTPRMYPLRSEKSSGLNLAAPLRLLTWALKTDPAPLRCARITRPIFGFQYLQFERYKHIIL